MIALSDYMIRNEVKEAFDKLPSGVCFFSENGNLILCNTTMHWILHYVANHDIQHLSELEAFDKKLPEDSLVTKDNNVYILPDGTAWIVKDSIIRDTNNNKFIQVLATNVTDIYNHSKELEKSNDELRKMAENLKAISENVVAITREEEILTMKMHIHNLLGGSILRTTAYHQVGDLKSDEQKAELISEWRNTIDLLKNQIEDKDDTDVYEELQEVAESLGITIERKGTFNPGTEAATILIATIRECLTNALKYANATKLFVIVEETTFEIKATISNNGTPPKKAITEGGGLTAIRKRIENAGGIMTVRSFPSFSLTVSIPNIY